MRRLHLRFRVRTLLVLVALAALALWIVRISLRHKFYLSRSQFYARGEDRATYRVHLKAKIIDAYQSFDMGPDEIQKKQEELAAQRDLEHYYRTLRTKYELAAARPWTLVAPRSTRSPPRRPSLYPRGVGVGTDGIPLAPLTSRPEASIQT